MSLTDRERLILNIHALDPGCTSRIFRQVSEEEDMSTYDVLAGRVPMRGAALHILDLGCGDGYLLERLLLRDLEAPALFGIDMSPEELGAAKHRGLDADLRCERADALSLPSLSFDYVLCNLAFQVMTNRERVLGEILRVLKPGGEFHAIIHGTQATSIGSVIGKLLLQFLEREKRAPASFFYGERNGSPFSEENLRRLFREASGFVQPIEIEQLRFRIRRSPEAIWEVASIPYDFHLLSERAKKEMRLRVMEELESYADAENRVTFDFWVRRISCVKCRC